MANTGTEPKSTKIKINKKAVDDLPFAGKGQQVDYWDTDLLGFGVRISHTSKTYIAMARSNGKLIRVTIGKHNPLTAENARKDAKVKLADMTKGINPNAVKAREAVRGTTLAAIAKQYFETQDIKASTKEMYKIHLDAHMQDWQKKPLTGITGDMVKKRYKKLVESNGRVAAINTMKVFRLMFNYAARQEGSELKDNPVAVLSSYMGKWSKVERRKTSIKDDLLSVWWTGLDYVTNPPAKDLLKILLFTGMRKNEAQMLKWSEVDMNAKTFTLLDPKNRNTITLPMSTTIEEIFQNRFDSRINEYVFPGSKFGSHLVDVRKQIENVEQVTIKILNGIDIDADLNEYKKRKKADLTPGITFMPHDLRRTFSTIAQNIVSYPELKRLLNHSSEDDVTQGYLMLTAEKLRVPMQRITDRINEIISGTSAMVETDEIDESKLDTIRRLISELGTDKVLALVKDSKN